MMDKRKLLNIEIGLRLQASRESADYTQELLAEKIERTTQFVSMLERGLTGPSLETVVRLSEVLNVSTEWLLRGRRATESSAGIAEKIALLSEAQQAVAGKVVDNLLELARLSEKQLREPSP